VDANGRIWSRHVFAWFQMLASLGLYVLVFFLKRDDLVRIPALCLVLMLAMLACWTFGALTFTLDRFRIPLITVVLAYGTAVSVFPQGDHFFRTIQPGGAPRDFTPAQVLGRRAGDSAVVVSAMGGGIHAGAWVARVLAGLQIDSVRCGLDFGRALTVISSVSGGSMGAMYIVDTYNKDGSLPTEAGLSHAVKAAEGSSLDDVAWALTYPDLVWSIFPFLKGISFRPSFTLANGANLVLDRGTVLEDSWKRTPSLEAATLDAWRSDLVRGIRPAVIFNSTVVETGERMLLGTTTIGTGKAPGRTDFGATYPKSDVLVVTAARLSSTFPYVTPPARIEPNGRFTNDFHLVDGGYYDNYGTVTLVEWLAEGLKTSTRPPSRILLLEIRTFPESVERTPDARRGWIFEATHPLVTLATVRGAAQLSTARTTAELVQRAYASFVTTLTFAFPARAYQNLDDVGPALSWHLTPDDRSRLRAAWSDVDTKFARTNVLRFLKGDHDTAKTIAPCIQ
jgi:hypothetical protein